MKRYTRVHWILFAVPIVALLCAASLIFARALPPRYQASLINRLPAFARPLAQSLILPVYPANVPTPLAQTTADVAALLTPRSTAPPRPASHTPSATATPSATPTLPPTLTTTPPAAQNLITPSPVVPPGARQAARSTPATLQAADVFLTGFKHIYQSWNNCGPATTSMNLSYYGWTGGQADAAQFLKPDPEDKNVSPHEIVSFVQALGFNATLRINGSMSLLKSFLQARIPVLIEKGFEPDPQSGWEGHYELIIGYNDTDGEFIAMDSYTGPNQSVPYASFDWYWSHFNRTFIVIHTPGQAETVAQLLGADVDPASNNASALATAQAEAAADPSNPFAWFNVGSSFVALGEYDSAAAAYDQARNFGLPWRMTWYQFGIVEAYYRTGRFDDVLTLADATLAKAPEIEELWYYRGLVYQARGDIDAARNQFDQALKHNPNFKAAADALTILGQ